MAHSAFRVEAYAPSSSLIDRAAPRAFHLVQFHSRSFFSSRSLSLPCSIESTLFLSVVSHLSWSTFSLASFDSKRVRPGANVGPGAGAELKPRELTIAASPMLSTRRRSAIRSSSVGGAGVQSSEQVELDEAASKQFKARPMPDYSKLAAQVCCV